MTVDLSQLDPPDAIEVPSFESIRDEILDALAEEDPLLASISESDPAYHVATVCAYREVLVRQKFNDAVRALLLSSSWGTNLDHLAGEEDVERAVTVDATGVEVAESDDALRARTLEEKQSRGAGVKEAYEAAAVAADARVSAVLARSASPATVDVEWVPAIGTDSGDYAEIQANVDAAVQDDDVRVIGDQVTTTQATGTTWSLTAKLLIEPGPDPAKILADAEAAIRAWDLANRRPRRPRLLTAISAVLSKGDGTTKVTGVVGVEFTLPAADLTTSGAEYFEIDAVTLTHEVASWL